MFPTDFSVIRILPKNDHDQNIIIEKLSKKQEIKHIIPHMRFVKPTPQNLDDKIEDVDDYDFVNYNYDYLNYDYRSKSPVFFSNPKKNGRMTTKWMNTFDNYYNNYHSNYWNAGRKLFTETQDPSFDFFEGLGIEKFWKKGYYGQVCLNRFFQFFFHSFNFFFQK